MTRHYLEGLLAALCASALFVLSVRRPPGPAATMLAVAGATLLLLATTAKEIYVPLVILLAFLPESSWRRRLRALAPFAAVAVIYTLWRFWMLGAPIPSPDATTDWHRWTALPAWFSSLRPAQTGAWPSGATTPTAAV